MTPSLDTLPFPPAFRERLARIVPPDRLPEVIAAYHRPGVVGFRINTLRATAADVVTRLHDAGIPVHPVPWKADAFWTPPAFRAQLLASEDATRQHLYVQNLASMVPVEVLAPRPGERVLDLAAAPGSKTLQIACHLQGEGELVAVEAVRSRFFRLRANLTAQGATFVRTLLRDGATAWHHRPEYFDRVLLDAPCSSEGRFHASDPASYAYWRPRKIQEMARKQQRLLFSAVQCLRPGGVLVYATCSLAPEENEDILRRALDTFGTALEVDPIDLPLEERLPGLTEWDGTRFPPELTRALRLLPSRFMEGFFVCRLRKVRSTLPASTGGHEASRAVRFGPYLANRKRSR